MKKRTVLYAVLTLAATAALLTFSSWLAVTCFIGNIAVFAAMTVVFPSVCVSAAAFIIGRKLSWNWKRGLLLALILTLISFGTGELITLFAGDELQSLDAARGTAISEDAAFMSELYDELDKQAYEYMLEQGLIAEGDAIYGGEPTGGEIVRSELYVDIEKSNAATELVGSAVDFMLAFVFGFLGWKVGRGKRSDKNEQ